MFKLHSEFKEFFSENNVEYFVSFYDIGTFPILSSAI